MATVKTRPVSPFWGIALGVAMATLSVLGCWALVSWAERQNEKAANQRITRDSPTESDAPVLLPVQAKPFEPIVLTSSSPSNSTPHRVVTAVPLAARPVRPPEVSPYTSASVLTTLPEQKRASGKRHFDPDKECPGDARIIDPDQIRWIQGQLTEARERASAYCIDLRVANQLARQAAAFTYQKTPGWPRPDTVETCGYGDCAGKSLWLATRLLEAGYTDVGIRLGVGPNYVVGEPGHAWVVLYLNGREFVFEPTNRSEIFKSQTDAPTRDHMITATVLPEDLM